MSELNQFIEDLSDANEFTIWDPYMDEPHLITNETTRLQIVEWMQSQSVEFDEEATIAFRQGARCGCAHIFMIEISPSNLVAFSGHDLLLHDKDILYRPIGERSDELQHPLLTAGVLKEAVNIKLSYDKAVLLAMMFHEMLENEDLSYGEQDTIEHALRELPDVLTDEILEDYEGFRKRTEEKASRYYW